MMINTIKRILGIGPTADLKIKLQEGAVILDVRTESEFRGGHIKDSINIPLQVLIEQVQKIPRDKVLITCCASGMRSASAKAYLKKVGFQEVYNGGGWQSLHKKIK